MSTDKPAGSMERFLLSKDVDYLYGGISLILTIFFSVWTFRSALNGWSALHDVVFNIYGIVLYAVVAALFFRRTVALRTASLKDNIIPFLSFASPAAMIFIGGYFPAMASFPIVSIILYIVGCFVAIGSLLTLGKSFSVLPALRQVVTKGPYRYIRHPAYLGEGLYGLGIVLFRINWITIIVMVVGAVLTIVRILIEEKVLSSSDEYKEYCKNTRYRLVPGIW